MNIWFARPPIDIADETGFGRLVTAPEKDQLCVAACDSDLASAPPVAGWLVPAGSGAHLPLLQAIVATGSRAILTVNGLGDRGLACSLAALAGIHTTLAFDGGTQRGQSVVEQLAWLSASGHPFALISDCPELLLFAAAMGAHDLVVTETVVSAPLLRTAAIRRAGSSRPTSPGEIDWILGREASLCARKSLPAGGVLKATDLAVAVTSAKGLNPALAPAVVGQTLRYALEAGEPLHFGHLDRPFASFGNNCDE